MGLENTLETLDGLSDRRKALYTEKDGKFELDEDYQTEDINPLKNALQRQKEANATAKEKEAELQAIIDDNALKLAEAAGDKKEVERLKQVALDKQKGAHDAELAESKKTIHDLTIGMKLSAIAAEIYIHPAGVNLTELESRIKLGEDGKTVSLVNKLGEKVTEKEIIDEFKADESMAYAIKAGAGAGGGADGGDAGGKTFAGKKLSEMTMQEKIAFHKSKMKVS